MDMLNIVDGDAKRELGLSSLGVRSWCIQGICANGSMKFFNLFNFKLS